MTSRLFVLERVKKELDRQLTLAKSSNLLTTTISPAYDDENEENVDDDEEEDTDDFDVNFLEDLKADPDKCAFQSVNQQKCLTNSDVYRLLYNQSDLLKLSKAIENQIHPSNEAICTSIDLSSFSF